MTTKNSNTPVEPEIEPTHPALDVEVNATDAQNQIDLNDPTLSGREAVKQNLARQAR